ncbi:MAG: hypothetical protein CMM93_03335 [Rickettsiales bacterium]|nr:hypothetical protein [Rickettsiales bacterium]|tara:strand:- start:371 stop:805 length:435 start_codon:yes stop_codon:yes gene_type:complete
MTPMTILHIEDDEMDAELMQAAMCSAIVPGSFAITQVNSLRSALKAMEETRYDAILLDMNLADISGIDNVRVVTQESPETPVIILSGAEDDNLAEKSVRYGARHYLVKGKCDGTTIRDAILSTLKDPEAINRAQIASYTTSARA